LTRFINPIREIQEAQEELKEQLADIYSEMKLNLYHIKAIKKIISDLRKPQEELK
jgi:uncharacterized protein (UPF0335 family)